MKALLYKEFEMVKYYVLLVIVLLSGFTYSLVVHGNLYIIPLIMVYVPLVFSQQAFYQDEQSRVEMYYISSPIGRTKVVISRYMTTWLFSILSLILMVVGQIIHFTDIETLFLMASISFVVPTLLNVVNIPINIKFGIQKGRYFLVVIMMLMFVLPALFGIVASSTDIIAPLTALINYITSIPYLILGVAIIIVGLLLNVGSVYLSLVLYKKKPF